MNELNKLIEQAFNAHSDCYADTWSQDGLGAPMVEGEVIRAITLESFKKAINEILASRPTCGKEQRKFLDEVEKLVFSSNDTFAILEKRFNSDLEKVTQGE